MKKIHSAVLAASLVLAGGLVASAQSTADNGWNYKITPYFWAMGIDGDVGFGNVTAPIDLDFSDAVKDLEVGGMLSLEADRGDWILFADGSYINLDDKNTTQYGTFRAEVEQMIFQGAVGYKLVKDPKIALDVGLGGRFIDTDIDMNVPSDRADLSRSKGWGDPIVIMRLTTKFAKNCFGVLSGDIGGFGIESDLTAQINVAAGYSFTETVSMLLGYRYLYYDYEDDSFSYDADTSGLTLGVSFAL